jgi:hypothetical protein
MIRHTASHVGQHSTLVVVEVLKVQTIRANNLDGAFVERVSPLIAIRIGG